MLEKLGRNFSEDITPLLPLGITFTENEAIHAFNTIWTTLICLIKGEPWKRSEEIINEVRNTRIPNLLP